MQKVEIIKQDNNCIIALHPIIDNELVLSFSEAPTNEFKSIKRKKEWLTTHYILENIFKTATTYSYNNINKPVLINQTENISISHSTNYAAIIISKNKKVGIDIEEISQRIHKIAHKFLHPSEKDFVNNNTEMLYLIWSAKEAIYKLSDIFLDFASQIIIEKFSITNYSKLKANIIFPDNSKVIDLEYIINDQYVLVWVLD